ncbi:MAG: sigma-70 family RNA polymerase sigma factor [Pirellula sp.]
MTKTNDHYADLPLSLSQKNFLADVARKFRIDRLELLNEICMLFPGRESRFVGATDAYLAGTARNVAKNLLRKNHRFRKRHLSLGENESIIGSNSSDAPSEFEIQDAIESCRAAVSRLPATYRDVIVACCLEGQSPREYSRLRNIAYENVRVTLRRAKSMLRRDAALVQAFS